jgi:hypothetical protein
MQRLIDQLIPVLTDQHASLDSVRAMLATTNLHWDTNDHNMNAPDKVQDMIKEQLLLRLFKVVTLYRKMMRTVEELRGAEAARKRKRKRRVDEEKLLMTELDGAVDCMEGLVLD